MSQLSAEDLEFWKQYGYVVVRGAAAPENCRAAAQAVWEFLEMNSDDPETWYPDPPRRSTMVEIYQHQALWDNRQFPRVHEAFAQIWQNQRLWVSFDRASMNPPARDDFRFDGFLHWDIDLTEPVPLLVQGVLYLTDTADNQGAFTCIPGFHHKLETWLKTLPDGADPRQAVCESYAQEAVYVAGNTGDLIIWHSALPHGSSTNTSDKPRIAQYITMSPSREYDDELRQQRIVGWRERLTGLGQNQPEREHHQGKTANLTPLGRRLLGLNRWDSEEQNKTEFEQLSDLHRKLLSGGKLSD